MERQAASLQVDKANNNSSSSASGQQLRSSLLPQGVSVLPAAPSVPAPTGMTSLYGKLRHQAVNAAAASVSSADTDAPAAASSRSTTHSAPFSVSSSAGTGPYGGLKGQRMAASAFSNDASSISTFPLQYSLFSASSTTSSTTTSSMRSHSTTGSVVAADQGPLRIESSGPSFSATLLRPAIAPDAPVALPPSAAAPYSVLDTMGLSASQTTGWVPDSTDRAQECQALLALLQAAGSSSAVQPQAPPTAHASLPTGHPASMAVDASLLQQLQQLSVKHGAAAQPLVDSSSTLPNQGISELLQQQLLMQQLKALQDSQAGTFSSSSATTSSTSGISHGAGMHPTGLGAAAAPQAAAVPQTLLSDLYGSCAVGASGASFSLNTAAPVQLPGPGLHPLTAGPAEGTRMQQHDSNDWALAQLLAQLGPDAGFGSTASGNSGLAGYNNQLPGTAAPMGVSLPTAGAAAAAAGVAAPSSAVMAALEGIKQRLLLGSAGVAPAAAPGQVPTAAAPTNSGVFGNLAGLAAAATAAVGGWAGLLPAGKHTLQMGPGSNPMYKTELCRTWIETGGCRYGSRCQFAHGANELRPIQRHPKYKTQPCRTFALHGSCPYGDRCNFIHDQQLQVSNPAVLVMRSGDSATSLGPGCGV